MEWIVDQLEINRVSAVELAAGHDHRRRTRTTRAARSDIARTCPTSTPVLLLKLKTTSMLLVKKLQKNQISIVFEVNVKETYRFSSYTILDVILVILQFVFLITTFVISKMKTR